MTFYTINQSNLIVTITGFSEYYAPFSTTYAVNTLYSIQKVTDGSIVEIRLVSDNSLVYTFYSSDSVTISGVSYAGVGAIFIVDALNVVFAYTNIPTASTIVTELIVASVEPTYFNLPDATVATDTIYNIKKIDSSINSVILQPFGGQLIDNVLTKKIKKQNTSISVQSNGSNWFII